MTHDQITIIILLLGFCISNWSLVNAGSFEPTPVKTYILPDIILPVDIYAILATWFGWVMMALVFIYSPFHWIYYIFYVIVLLGNIASAILKIRI